MPLPRRVYGCPAQQPAHGLLPSLNHCERCATSWIESAAGGCDEVGVELHGGCAGRWWFSLVVGQEEISYSETPRIEHLHDPAPEGRNSLAQDGSPGKVQQNSPKSRRDDTPSLLLGLRYVRGLREEAAQVLVRERNRAPFTSIHDLTHRVPELRKDELNTLAEIGALNSIANSPRSHGPRRKTKISATGFQGFLRIQSAIKN